MYALLPPYSPRGTASLRWLSATLLKLHIQDDFSSCTVNLDFKSVDAREESNDMSPEDNAESDIADSDNYAASEAEAIRWVIDHLMDNDL